jgi:chemotaxis signal transduction protein
LILAFSIFCEVPNLRNEHLSVILIKGLKKDVAIIVDKVKNINRYVSLEIIIIENKSFNHNKNAGIIHINKQKHSK